MQYSDSANKEITGSSSPKIAFLEYLFVLILIIYAGRANSFVESASFTHNVVAVMLPIVLSGILVLRRKVIFEASFFLVSFGLAFYFIAISIKYKEIQPTFFLSYFFMFFTVYGFVRALKLDFFRMFEDILYKLSIIALIAWIIQVGLRGDSLFNLISKIPGIDIFSRVTGEGVNVIVYSVQPSFSSLLYNFAFPRNCGFAWEPGAFAVFICLAIFVNLFFTKSDSKNKYHLWVLVIALLTTQSTPGYIIFMVIILSYLLNKKLNIVILLLPVMVILMIYISSLPFMANKVVGLIDESKSVDQVLQDAYGRETSSTPQRFTSFMIALVDFKRNPIFGVGGHQEDLWTTKIGANISAITGIGNFLAQFGLVGFSFLIIVLYKSSLFFSKYFGYNGKLLLFFIMLLLSVSYSIIFIPFFMCFWMFQLFSADNILKEKLNNVDPGITNKPEDH